MLEQTRLNVQAALDAKTPTLINEIRRMLVDRPFAFNPGADKSSVNGIHFEYASDSFQTVACPLNTSTGYCGRGALLALTHDRNRPLISSDFYALQLRDTLDEDTLRDELNSIVDEVFCRWFAAAWTLARVVDPSVRGFLSVHDTIWRTDLDTGEDFREDSGHVKFF